MKTCSFLENKTPKDERGAAEIKKIIDEAKDFYKNKFRYAWWMHECWPKNLFGQKLNHENCSQEETGGGS